MSCWCLFTSSKMTLAWLLYTGIYIGIFIQLLFWIIMWIILILIDRAMISRGVTADFFEVAKRWQTILLSLPHFTPWNRCNSQYQPDVKSRTISTVGRPQLNTLFIRQCHFWWNQYCVPSIGFCLLYTSLEWRAGLFSCPDCRTGSVFLPSTC